MNALQSILPRHVFEVFEEYIQSEAIDVQVEREAHSGRVTLTIPLSNGNQGLLMFLPQQIPLDFSPSKPVASLSPEFTVRTHMEEIRGLIVCLRKIATSRLPSQAVCERMLAVLEPGMA